MTILVVALLVMAASASCGLEKLSRYRAMPRIFVGVQCVALSAAAIVALGGTGLSAVWEYAAVAVAAALAASWGGYSVTQRILEQVQSHTGASHPGSACSPESTCTPRGHSAPHNEQEVLRGGTWIGILERIAAVVTLMSGWPEGLAVVLAVKSLARYSELKTNIAAAEKFMIGTLSSILWACACAGVAVLTYSAPM